MCVCVVVVFGFGGGGGGKCGFFVYIKMGQNMNDVSHPVQDEEDQVEAREEGVGEVDVF